jgi:hypothetical protein
MIYIIFYPEFRLRIGTQLFFNKSTFLTPPLGVVRYVERGGFSTSIQNIISRMAGCQKSFIASKKI